MIETIKQLYVILDASTRLQFALLLLPMIVITGLEVLSIGLVLPLILVLIMGNQEGPFTEIVAMFLPTMKPGQLAVWVIILFVVAFIIKNILILIMIFSINLVVANKIAIYGRKLFDIYMFLPLEFHFENNSSAILVNIRTGLGLTIDTVRLVLMMALDLMLILGAFSILLFTQATAVIAAASALGIIGLIYYRVFSPIFRYWGQMGFELENNMFKWITQTFDSIRDVKIMGAQEYLGNIMLNIGKQTYRYECYSKTSIQIPRLLIETTVIIGLLGVVVLLKATNQSPTDLIYALGLFGMASLRLMPSLNRLMTSSSELRRSAAYISTIHQVMSEKVDNKTPKI